MAVDSMRGKFKEKLSKLRSREAPRTLSQRNASTVSLNNPQTVSSSVGLCPPATPTISTILASSQITVTSVDVSTPVSRFPAANEEVIITTSPGSIIPPTSSDIILVTQDRQIWTKALDKLSEPSRLLIEQHISRNSAVTDLEIHDLIKSVQDKGAECSKKKWCIKLQGREVSLGDTADTIVSFLERIKLVGTIAVAADPVHAGLPWAAIRFLLQVAVSDREQMSTLLLGVSRIIYIIGRCKIYEDQYLHHPNMPEATQRLEMALVNLYALALKFLASGLRTIKQRTIARAFSAFWHLEEIKEFDGKLNQCEKDIDAEAGLCYQHESKTSERESTQRMINLKDKLQVLEKLSSPIGNIDTMISALWLRYSDQDRVEILKWISNIPYQDDQNNAKNERVKDTGDWIFEKDEYKAWRSSNESKILWVHGSPGAGKTKLVSRTIDRFLNDRCEERFAYFYCNRAIANRRDPESILQCFIKQLSVSSDERFLHKSLIQVYHEKKKLGFASNRLTLTECKELLLCVIGGYYKTILILDALDEISKDNRAIIIEAFDFLRRHSHRLNIFISSRPETDISSQYKSEANIGIESTDNQSDIKKFVSSQINKDHQRRKKYQLRPISENLQNEIARTLLEKSQGMFQWAALQIAQILDLDRESDMKDRLGKLPKDLKAAYDQIFEDIKRLKGSKPEIAIRAFQWVMCACRPLTSDTLVAAVCQDPDDRHTNPVDIDVQFVLDACRNLINSKKDSRGNLEFGFSHLSVHEYFEEYHWTSNQANGAAAKVCLSLLNEPENFSQALLYKRNPDNSIMDLLDYARLYWLTHIRQYDALSHDERLVDLLEIFLGSTEASSLAYRDWHKYCTELPWYDKSLPFSGDVWDELTPCTSISLPVYLFGLKEIFFKLWNNRTISGEEQNKMGHSAIVLLAIGSSPTSIQNSLRPTSGAIWLQSSSILAKSIRKDYEAILEQLIASKIDLNAHLHGLRYGNVLTAASYWGNFDMVQVLVENSADVNANLSSGWFGSALEAAVCRKHLDLVQLLIEFKADVNMQLNIGSFGSALVAAAYMGSLDIMHLLVSKGARVNEGVENGEFGSALAAAAYGAGIEEVQLLIDLKADINAELGHGTFGSALVAASDGGNIQVMKLLIDNGADVNTEHNTGEFGSALIAAVTAGRMAKVQLLLDNGAEINSKVGIGKYGNAVIAAVDVSQSTCDKSTILLLVDNGADVNAQVDVGDYQNMLDAARDSDDANMVPFVTELMVQAKTGELNRSCLVPFMDFRERL